MSLSKFVALPEVVERLKPFRPKGPRKLTAPLIVEPRSKRYPLVGTAFDYLLRFELQRRVPHAITSEWIAEAAPDVIWRKVANGTIGRHVLIGIDPAEQPAPKQLAEDVQRVIEAAKSCVTVYIRRQSLTDADRAEVAAHALRLAKLDSVYRAHQLDPQYTQVAPEDVEDLTSLLAAVPFAELVQPGALYLNPTFGSTSHLVTVPQGVVGGVK